MLNLHLVSITKMCSRYRWSAQHHRIHQLNGIGHDIDAPLLRLIAPRLRGKDDDVFFALKSSSSGFTAKVVTDAQEVAFRVLLKIIDAAAIRSSRRLQLMTAYLPGTRVWRLYDSLQAKC